MNIWTSENNQTIIINERFDKKTFQFILENWNDPYLQDTLHQFSSIKEGGEDGEDNTKQLRTIYKKYVKQSNSDGTIEVSYRQKGSKQRKGGLIGRYFATGSLSLQSITRPIRQAVCSDYYWDIDIVNAHPNILMQYCKFQKIPCPILESYVKDRDSIIKNSTISKATFKTEFLAILNGRQFRKQFRIQNVDDFFTQWNLEATKILERTVALNKDILPSKKDYNENGSVTNKFICSIENKILFNTFNFLAEREYEPEVLCFDGLMIRKKGEISDLERTLKDLSDYVHEKTDYRVEFIVKPMTDGLDLSKISGKQTTDEKETVSTDKLPQSVQELFKTIDRSQSGYADLFVDIYGKEHVKILSCKPFFGYNWDDEQVLWVPINSPTYLCKIVSNTLVNHIEEQIKIIKNFWKKNETDQSIIASCKASIHTIHKEISYVCTINHIESIIKFAITSLLEPKFSSLINNYESLLPISDGRKIDLKTLQITDRTINDYFDNELSVNYTDDEKELSVIDTFMFEIMGIREDFKELYPNHDAKVEKEAFQVILGYMISGCNKEKMYTVWHGEGGDNGKSTLSGFISQVFGKYAAPIDKSVIEQINKPKGNSHNSALIATKGVHIGFIHETTSEMTISSADLKALTSGGEDVITARQCQGIQEEFMPRFKLAILCNNKPKIDGTDVALGNRTRYIPFLNKFEICPANKAKIENLKTNYRDAFFSWCAKGAHKYFSTNILPKTDLQTKGAQEFIQENDTLQLFINEHCNVGEFFLDVNGNPTNKKARYKCSEFRTDYLRQYPEAQVKNLAKALLTKNKQIVMTPSTGVNYFRFIRKKEQQDEQEHAELEEKPRLLVNPMLAL
jgi:phage/plasmid-associated DNA primase